MADSSSCDEFSDFGPEGLGSPQRRSGNDPPPLSPPSRETPSHVLQNDVDACCAICFEDLHTGDPNIYSWPSCSHRFHLECAWLHAYNSGVDVCCPMCRADLAAPARMELLRATHAARVLDTPAPATPVAEQAPVEPAHVSLLCCQRVGPPPECTAYGDRRMTWSVRRLWRRNAEGQIEFRRHAGTGVLHGIPEGWWSGWTCHGCHRDVASDSIPAVNSTGMQLCCWGCGPMVHEHDFVSGSTRVLCGRPSCPGARCSTD